MAGFGLTRFSSSELEYSTYDDRSLVRPAVDRLGRPPLDLDCFSSLAFRRPPFDFFFGSSSLDACSSSSSSSSSGSSSFSASSSSSAAASSSPAGSSKNSQILLPRSSFDPVVYQMKKKKNQEKLLKKNPPNIVVHFNLFYPTINHRILLLILPNLVFVQILIFFCIHQNQHQIQNLQIYEDFSLEYGLVLLRYRNKSLKKKKIMFTYLCTTNLLSDNLLTV